MTLNGTLLLVDDEAHIRKYVGLIVRQLGRIRLVEAANGEEAIDVYQREKPTWVLLDVNMPHMDGIETLRRLKALDPDCRVVMLTSLANRLTVEETANLGAVNYIRKDATRDELTKALTESLQSSIETGNDHPSP
jgi:two-component system chemotaxis response regulator CheY